MHCIFVNSLIAPQILPDYLSDKNGLNFPEKRTSMVEQRQFNPAKTGENYDYVITNSPFIVGCFRAINVSIYDAEKNEFSPPIGETYGGSFDVLLKQMNQLKSLLPQIVVDDIRLALDGDPKAAISHLNSFAPSSERAYLLHRLEVEVNESTS
jgi:hypothetical protein